VKNLPLQNSFKKNQKLTIIQNNMKKKLTPQIMQKYKSVSGDSAKSHEITQIED